MTAQIFSLLSRPRPDLRGLTDQDCFTIAASLRGLPGGAWLAQRDEETDGTVAMTLFATDEDSLPMFAVRREIGGFRLECGRSGCMLGHYTNMPELMRAARRKLEA